MIVFAANMSLAQPGQGFILSSEDPHWNADETESEFYSRCLIEMGNNDSAAIHSGETPDSACDKIMNVKKYGLYGPGYTDIRQLFIIVVYRQVDRCLSFLFTAEKSCDEINSTLQSTSVNIKNISMVMHTSLCISLN